MLSNFETAVHVPTRELDDASRETVSVVQTEVLYHIAAQKAAATDPNILGCLGSQSKPLPLRMAVGFGLVPARYAMTIRQRSCISSVNLGACPPKCKLARHEMSVECGKCFFLCRSSEWLRRTPRLAPQPDLQWARNRRHGPPAPASRPTFGPSTLVERVPRPPVAITRSAGRAAGDPALAPPPLIPFRFAHCLRWPLG